MRGPPPGVEAGSRAEVADGRVAPPIAETAALPAASDVLGRDRTQPAREDDAGGVLVGAGPLTARSARLPGAS